MKNGKRPTLKQKKLMRSHGLTPENWLVVKNTQEFLEVVSRTSLKKIGGKPKLAMLTGIETICLEGIDPDVMEADWVNLQNSTVTIMVPEDTTDEQLQLVTQKFASAYIIVNKSQVQKDSCQLSDDPMPDIDGLVGAYGI